MQAIIAGKTLELVQGDITQQAVDAIVNAANSRLAGGGGVDGAIHRGGGPAIMAETNARYPGGCPTGSAVISSAGDLSAKYVIHAVGPVWRGGGDGEAQQLASAYRRCFELAASHDCESIALPAISCGVYGYPIERASRVALETAIDFMRQHERPTTVRFVLFSDDTFAPFGNSLRELMEGAAGLDKRNSDTILVSEPPY